MRKKWWQASDETTRYFFFWLPLFASWLLMTAEGPIVSASINRLPNNVAEWVRPGLRIMTMWSAAIAWRRFLQGVMIHFNQPRKMAWGTAIRLLASGGTVIGLATFTAWPGVVNGTTALMAGVIAEAIYATIAIRPLLNNELSTANHDNEPPLTYHDLFWFHLPLAGTAVMVLLVQPLVTFSLALTTAVAVGVALFTFTPLAESYLFGIQDMTTEVGTLAQNSLLYFLPFPALTVVGMWLRGVLINGRKTTAVNIAMVINMIVTIIVLGLGLAGRRPGLPTAAVALALAMLAEIIYLGWRSQRLILLQTPWPMTPLMVGKK